MNVSSAKTEMKRMGRANRPFNIGMGVCFATAAIYIDFYLAPSKRGIAQQLTWSFLAVGSLFIATRRIFRRKQLISPFILTLIVQCLFAYAVRPLFPFANSLILIIFWAAGVVVLGVVFACFARILDPFGPRPM
jgi:hypothetical protein